MSVIEQPQAALLKIYGALLQHGIAGRGDIDAALACPELKALALRQLVDEAEAPMRSIEP
jgi:hypothetical protein